MASAASPSARGPAALLPGLLLSAGVAIAAVMAEPWLKALTGGRLALPAMVLALVIGIVLHRLAQKEMFQPGLTYTVKTLLRYAIALLGLRIAFADFAALGWQSVLLAATAMAATIVAGLATARLLGQQDGLGALCGAACAVCGASATLATATVVPDYRSKSADIAFTVVMANAISTVVMLLYPWLCTALGLSAQETGLMLGLTIHDMAQVAGAGYAVSEPVGNTAVIVKLFRVLLLLPVVLAIGHWLARQGTAAGRANVPVPGFAVAFIALAIVNSIVPATPLAAAYAPVKATLATLSHWGLLLAISALGLGSSATAVFAIGWRHLAIFLVPTLVLLAITLAAILMMR